jgi:hypothetical protein
MINNQKKEMKPKRPHIPKNLKDPISQGINRNVNEREGGGVRGSEGTKSRSTMSLA